MAKPKAEKKEQKEAEAKGNSDPNTPAGSAQPFRGRDGVELATKDAKDGADADQRSVRLNLRDSIEREVVRHEKAIEDFIGGKCTCEPPRTPMMLHELRRQAVRAADDPTTDLETLRNTFKALHDVEFVYPTDGRAS